MSREVRMVPRDWEHPKYENGAFIPLHNSSYKTSIADWAKGKEDWDKGNYPDYASEENKKLSYEECAGEEPDPDDYMPTFSSAEATCFMMYETTSEGTPISPAFETEEELAQWLSENKASAFGRSTATYEQWLNTIRRGRSIGSMVIFDGKIMSGVEVG